MPPSQNQSLIFNFYPRRARPVCMCEYICRARRGLICLCVRWVRAFLAYPSRSWPSSCTWSQTCYRIEIVMRCVYRSSWPRCSCSRRLSTLTSAKKSLLKIERSHRNTSTSKKLSLRTSNCWPVETTVSWSQHTLICLTLLFVHSRSVNIQISRCVVEPVGDALLLEFY